MKVTILIVNYKNWRDTIECLESVYKSSYHNIDVVVVDNSPNDHSIKNLTSWAKGNLKVGTTNFPDLIFPEKEKPLNYALYTENEYAGSNILQAHDIIFIKARNNGFASANNIVLNKLIKSSTQKGFIFLLNNDTVIGKNTITNLVNNYTKKTFGLVGCVLLEYKDPNIVQSVGGEYNKIFGTTRQVLEGVKKEQVLDKNKVKIDYPSGAAMFMSVERLLEIGSLDESYFLYYEELDWVKRAEKKYKTTYFENCQVYHKGGVSIGSNNRSYLADKYSIINRINFAKKHNKKNLATIYVGVSLSIIKRMLSFKFSRCISLVKDVIKNEN